MSPSRFGAAYETQPTAAAQWSRRGNRRRLAVFVGVLAIAGTAGQAWNFLRPDVYRASTLLQVRVPDAGLTGARAASAPLADSLPLMTSRPLLAQVARRMADYGVGLAGGDASAALQSMLQVASTGAADVVAVTATGAQAPQLVGALRALPDALRESLADRQALAADDQLDAARAELARLDEGAQRLRGQADAYRRDASVQSERGEDEAVARMRGLNAALANAAEKETAAEARLRALTEAAAAGREPTPSREGAGLVAVDARAGQLRDELRDLERRFTPEFMALDPKARTLKARLAELEAQAATQRSATQTEQVQTAREDLAAARAQIERLKRDQAEARPALASATARFARARTIEDDLGQVEKARRELLERVARLEADQQRRTPSVAVLEEPLLPTLPYAPDRQADGLKALAAALALALAAMALVEVFNRSPAASAAPITTTVVLPGAALPSTAALGGGGGGGAGPIALDHAGGAGAALPAPPRREPLRQDEAAALLAAARSPVREAAALALSGLSPAELLALRTGDCDAAARALQVPGAWARSLALPGWLADALAALAADRASDAPLLASSAGLALEEPDLQSLLACAAVDGGLSDGAAVDAALLRDTCIHWLIDQGLRLSDLPQRVGRIEPSRVMALAARAGSARSLAADPAWPMPALAHAPAA